MRYLLAIIFLFVELLPGTSRSQVIRGYGFKVGLVSSNEFWQDTEPGTRGRWMDSYTGIAVGGFIELALLSHVSVVGEVQYAQKGMKGTEVFINGLEVPYNVVEAPWEEYLSIPIAAKIGLPVGLITPYLLAGPRVDFLLSSHHDGDTEAPFNRFKAVDYGGTFGCGVKWNWFFLEFRYDPDFTDSYDQPFYIIKNRSFDFYLGMEF